MEWMPTTTMVESAQPPVPSAAGKGQGKSPGEDFARVLNELANAAEHAGANKPPPKAAGEQKLSWRELQANRQGETAETAAAEGTGQSGNIAKLIQLLQGMMPQASDEILEAGGEEEALAQLQQLLRRLLEENGQQLAGGQMAALLNTLPQYGMETMAAQADPVTATGGDPQLQALMAALTAQNPTEPAAVLEQLQNGAFATAMAQTGAVDNTQAAEPAPALPGESRPEAKGAVEADMQYTAAAAPATKGDAKEAMSFDAAVRAAKDKLGERAPQQEAKPKDRDMDALQKQVDAGTYLRNTAIEHASFNIKAPAAPAQPLATQVAEGVSAGLQAGKTEFVMKLKPEGLGELTVRLVRVGEETSLSIVAKNAGTQRLLAADLDTLRENLKPLKVEVDSILTEQQHNLLSHQQASDQQQRQSWYQEPKVPAYHGETALGAEEAQPATTQPRYTTAGNAALDTYI